MAYSAIFGNYWAAESPVHRLDPRTKLICLLLAMIAVFCAQSFLGLAIAALFILAFFVIAKIPLGQAFKSIAPLLFIVVLTAILNVFFVQGGEEYVSWAFIRISHDGVYAAAFLGARLMLLILSASLLTLTTTTLDITDASESLLSPLARFRFPAHEFATVLGIALRFLPQFVSEAQTIRAAQVSRGAKKTSGIKGWLSQLTSVVIPLFTSAFRHAETLSSGMEARCYHGGAGRSRLHPLTTSSSDVVAVLVLICMIACVLASRLW